MLDALKPCLRMSGLPKSASIWADANVLANHDIRLRGIHEDTMLELIFSMRRESS